MNTPAAAANSFPFKSEEGRQTILTHYDKLLSQWPVPLKKALVGNTYPTHVLEWGNPQAAPLVLLHGSTSNSVTWMGEAAAYGEFFHVYAFDIPGDCGHSTPVRPQLSGEAYSAWLSDTLAQIPTLAGTPIHLLGLSLGGWVALQFSTRYPERVDKLGLLCPAGLGPQKAGLIVRILWHSLFGEKGTRRLIRDISGDDTQMPEEVVAYITLLSRHFHPIMDPIPPLTDEALGRLTMPVKLMAGGRDVMMHSEKSIERMSRCVPHATCVYLPDAPHALVNKAPDMVTFFLS
jgi:pimeloyl-ACP methyl ester carboxylesterase